MTSRLLPSAECLSRDLNAEFEKPSMQGVSPVNGNGLAASESVKYTNFQYKYDIQAGKVIANNNVDDLELASLNKSSDSRILLYLGV